ncbi:MAG: AI-2E family transporter [Rhodopirellula sp.]|nr:AI-2E family transporter [Rhodopirellula sp.]
MSTAQNLSGSSSLIPVSAAPAPLSIRLLAGLAVAYTFYFARALLFPIVMAIILAALLRPIVRWMKRRRIPEEFGAVLVIAGLVGTIGYGATRLVEPAQEWFQHPEKKVQELESKLRSIRQPIADVENVADKMNEAATGDSSEENKPIKVTVKQPSLVNNVISSTGQMMAGAAITLALLYFLLVRGNMLLCQVVQITPTRRGKRDAVELVHKIEQGVSSYLLSVTIINVFLGATIGIVMWLIGLPTPALWGTLAALLNFIPYVGGFVGCVMVFLVGVLSFDSLSSAVVAPLAYFVINTIEGNLITPALLGRRMSLNPIFVFLSLAFWGWIWGIGGVVLAVPLLTVIKIASEQFDSLESLATLLSGETSNTDH